MYVAELDRPVVGFVSGGQIREPSQRNDAELFAIYLLDQAQGRGIGTELLWRLVESLAANGFQSMAVWVLESNTAIHFYKESGAVPVMSKAIEIGGAKLQEAALGWPDLRKITAPS